MVRGKGSVAEKPKELLSSSEIESLRDEQKELQATISEVKEASGSSRSSSIDTNRLQSRVNYLEKAIEDRSPEEVRGKSKDSLVREQHELEDRFTPGMLTRYENDHPARCPGAVRKLLAWNARNDKLIRRWVEIEHILRPGEERSIEEFRPEGGPNDRGR